MDAEVYFNKNIDEGLDGSLDMDLAYQVFRRDVLRTWPIRQVNDEHARLGIISEIGEVADLFKKEIQKGTEILEERYYDEIGDVIFYISALNCMKERYTLEDLRNDLLLALGGTEGPLVAGSLHDTSARALHWGRVMFASWNTNVFYAMALNVEKRAKRFPNGFTVNELK